MIISFREKSPVLGEDVYLAPSVTVVGDVQVGDHSSIWFGTVARGDVHFIKIGEMTNVQDNSTLHVTGGNYPLVVGDWVTIGHNVVVHGCTIEDECLIGIGAKVLDGALIGKGSVIAAGALITPGTIIPPDSLVMGIPGKVVRQLGGEGREQTRSICMKYRDLAIIYLGRDRL
jgi:carbonic anhydrase/acetyltransferase-like protein (isoleucine patch superfamily)